MSDNFEYTETGIFLENENSEEYNDKLNSIIEEFAAQRNSLKEMVDDLNNIKQHIDNLFPKTLDRRYAHLFEQKMEAITGVFNTLLSVKKEIMKGLKEEFELRRKVGGGVDQDVEKMMEHFELSSVAEKVVKLKQEVDAKRKQREPLRTKGEKYVKTI